MSKTHKNLQIRNNRLIIKSISPIIPKHTIRKDVLIKRLYKKTQTSKHIPIMNFPKLCFLLLSFSIFHTVTTTVIQAQTKLPWETLLDAKFKYTYDVEQDIWYNKPNFNKTLQKLEGKEVIVQGFMVPVDVTGDTYVLSAFPFSACFFCGAAGKESVMEIRLKDANQRFETDQMSTFKGTLDLVDDVYGLMYVLEEAEVQ